MLELVSEYHKEWIKIATSFLGNKEDAEDLVHDMYLRVYRLKTFDQIKWNGKVNKYYIYITLRNLALGVLKNRRYNLELTDYEQQDEYTPADKALDILILNLHKEIDTWNNYDRHLFELYMYSGLSLRDISSGSDKELRIIGNNTELCKASVKRGTKISVSSIFHTIKKCKQKLKEKFGEDFEDYTNRDYERI